MQPDQLIDAVLAIGRVVVLILGMCAGTFTIYLGWRLYKDAIVSQTTGELSYKSLKIVLAGGGPGVFLAIFGAYLLVSITGQKVDLSSTMTAPQTMAGMSLQQDAPAIWHSAMQGSSAAEQNRTPLARANVRCVVSEYKRVLFSGETAARPPAIRKALDLALSSLGEIQSAQPESKLPEYRQATRIIEDLKAGVVE